MRLPQTGVMMWILGDPSRGAAWLQIKANQILPQNVINTLELSAYVSEFELVT